jgi:hypothetical protein
VATHKKCEHYNLRNVSSTNILQEDHEELNWENENLANCVFLSHFVYMTSKLSGVMAS